MKRALGFIVATLGTAWLLAGTGAVVSGFSAQERLEDFRNEEIASLEARTKAQVADFEDKRKDVEAKGQARIEEARGKVETLQSALQGVQDKHAPIIEAKESELASATESGRGRSIARAEASLARAIKRRDAALRRPQAKLQKAQAALEDTEASTAERVAAVDTQIAATRESMQTELTQIQKTETSDAGPSVLLPVLAALLGGLLMGVGIALVATGRSPARQFVSEGRVKAAAVDAEDDAPLVTLASMPRVTASMLKAEDDEPQPTLDVPPPKPSIPEGTDATKPEEPTLAEPRVT